MIELAICGNAAPGPHKAGGQGSRSCEREWIAKCEGIYVILDRAFQGLCRPIESSKLPFSNGTSRLSLGTSLVT